MRLPLLRVGTAVAVLATLMACAEGPQARQTPLRVVMADDWAQTDAVLDAVRAFEDAHEGVTVDLQGVPFSQIPDTVRAAAQTDSPIDVAHWHAFAAGAQGIAADLDQQWSVLDPDAFVPGAVEDVTWTGHRYGLPLDVNAMLLITNEDLLAAAGRVRPPTTMAGIREVAAAVADGGDQARGLAIAHSGWSTYGWIRAFGGEIIEIDDEGRPRVTLDDQRVVAALAFLGNLVRDQQAFAPTIRNESDDAFSIFRSGVSAFHTSGAWDVVALADAGIDWAARADVMPHPPGVDNPGTVLGGSSLFVPASSPNTDLAFAFMGHLTSDEYALRYAKEEGRLPSKRSLYDDPYFDRPVFQTVETQLETASPMKLIAFPEADRIYRDAIDRILTGQADAATALVDAQQRIERLPAFSGSAGDCVATQSPATSTTC